MFSRPQNSEAWKVALAEQLELQFLETKNALGQKVLNPRPPLSLDPQVLYQLSYVPFPCWKSFNGIDIYTRNCKSKKTVEPRRNFDACADLFLVRSRCAWSDMFQLSVTRCLIRTWYLPPPSPEWAALEHEGSIIDWFTCGNWTCLGSRYSLL